MVVVDTSVWIDFFKDNINSKVQLLSALLQDGTIEIVVPDVVLSEVLRGFRIEREYLRAKELMSVFEIPTLGGYEFALLATEHYRVLRSRGLTVRTLADVWIATYCIKNHLPLLHSDRDFDHFQIYRGLTHFEKFVF